MTISYAVALKNDRLDLVTTALDAGSGAGKCKIYSGTPPATADTALSGNTLLAVPLFNATAAGGAASGGVLTFDAFTDDSSADATGTATFCRGTDSDDNVVFQGSVGTSGTDMILDSTSITAGQVVSINSGSITHG